MYSKPISAQAKNTKLKLEEEGRIRIRVDTKTKPKTGGRFRLEGVWVCPPLNRGFWEDLEGLYTALYVR